VLPSTRIPLTVGFLILRQIFIKLVEQVPI
jgi:hypothetical protein